MCFLFFFFFKQKTAYEMRISDWSSDVCSSDLQYPLPAPGPRREGARGTGVREHSDRYFRHADGCRHARGLFRSGQGTLCADRSEEHTSELQSLMRISYAVFCLKKKTKKNKPDRRHPNIQRHSLQSSTRINDDNR